MGPLLSPLYQRPSLWHFFMCKHIYKNEEDNNSRNQLKTSHNIEKQDNQLTKIIHLFVDVRKAGAAVETTHLCLS